MDRERAKVSEVMFCPNFTSSGDAAPRRSATAAWASSRIASERMLVAKAPPWLAFVSR